MSNSARARRRPRSGGTAVATATPPTQRTLIEVLARAAREVDADARRGPLRPQGRVTFQVTALLMREERARIKTDPELSDGERADQLRNLEAVANSLVRTAARDTSLLPLLTDNSPLTELAKDTRRRLLRRAGIEIADLPAPRETSATPTTTERQVTPVSVTARQLANPFLAPDFSLATRQTPKARRLIGWELVEPLLRSFEEAGPSSPASMELPPPTHRKVPEGLELMRHQAEVVASAEDGHRTFLLADEPGLGKTAQALLAAEASMAYPLLVVVPNVVKANWAHEVSMWLPHRTSTVVHGDGDTIDGFADIVVVNYDILDRHVGWLGNHGFRGMVIDEAHFIKNKKSARSRHVLGLADRIRERIAHPLLMALTGTPLINDIEDFTAIWEFLGWIDAKGPTGELMGRLEETGLLPNERGFYAAARQAVIDEGIVRRRKIDVAADIPARRIADLPVELDDAAERSIRAAEEALAARLLRRYDGILAARAETGTPTILAADGIDHELVRSVAAGLARDEAGTGGEGNVFSLLRQIGVAKAELAADYAAQLARNVGKVVFFARHIDVMDMAEATFAKRGIGYVSVRGDQTRTAREKAIAAFTEDPNVHVIVCSLMAAGVGLNLQVSSNVVLAELSWTDAEQTQAIDRVHRIGQTEPVTAWRIVAAQTIDSHVAELIGAKATLAARALDGSTQDVAPATDIRVGALAALLVDALTARTI